ncbi:general secretion pathway protein GspK [Desulfonema magnum]|nr:general secretion pathway protein GspK [Desulfonema magnum]
MALLLTVTITTLLIAATLELNRKVRATVMTTATTRDRFTLSYMASAGVHAAMAMLIKDKMSDPGSGLDSIQEDWADPEKISEVLQAIPFEEGSVTFKISDELGKIQVNALVDFPRGRKFKEFQASIWDNLIRPVISLDEDRDINETTAIINSVKDWLDSGDDDAITGLSGAESEHYQALDPPYSCRNAPFTDLDEVARVKGINPELFYGAGEIPGISDYMTVYGMTKAPRKVDKKNFTYEGKININTAELPVLGALVGPENLECAQAIYDYRQESEETSDSKRFINSLSGSTWYKNAPGCSDVTINSKVITNSSNFFRIEATAKLHDIELTISAVVFRERDKKTRKWKCRPLSWQTL